MDNPIPQSSSEQPSQQPVVSSTAILPKSKLPLFLIAIFILLIILGSGGYYYLNTKSKITPQNNQSVSISPTVSQPSPTVTQDKTVNWKTYINEKIGITFKYPEEFYYVKENPAKPEDIIIDMTKSYPSNDNGYRIHIHTYQLKNGEIVPSKPEKLFEKVYKPLFAYAENYEGCLTKEGSKINEILLGGIKVYQRLYCYGGETAIPLSIVANNNNKLYGIYVSEYGGKGDLKERPLYFLILSTFKFTDQIQTNQNSYKKRQFDITKAFFENEKYPSEITSVPESQLIGMKCSSTYSSDYSGGFTYTDPSGKSTKANDQRLLDMVKMAKKDKDSSVEAGRYCDTEDGRTVFEYEEWGGGGGLRNIAHFGVISNNKFNTITSIPNIGFPYFGCQNPLELTTNNILYYSCAGGDGGFGGEAIYAIDLNKNYNRLLIKCTSQADDTTQGYTVTCK